MPLCWMFVQSQSQRNRGMHVCCAEDNALCLDHPEYRVLGRTHLQVDTAAAARAGVRLLPHSGPAQSQRHPAPPLLALPPGPQRCQLHIATQCEKYCSTRIISKTVHNIMDMDNLRCVAQGERTLSQDPSNLSGLGSYGLEQGGCKSNEQGQSHLVRMYLVRAAVQLLCLCHGFGAWQARSDLQPHLLAGPSPRCLGHADRPHCLRGPQPAAACP